LMLSLIYISYRYRFPLLLSASSRSSMVYYSSTVVTLLS
jgi:hypothetical protein